MTFDSLIRTIISEAGKLPNPPPNETEEEDNNDPNISANDGDVPADGGDGGEFGISEDELAGLGESEDEPVFPEEIELAKLAVRALYFNPASKSTHRYILTVGDKKIPFEKVSDYFEKTKKWKPILGFVEYVMDKFEGLASKWTEQPEIRGKGILDKIKSFNADNVPEDEKLDNGKRVYWARIVLNCLLYGKATYNLNIGDVNEANIKEVYRKLKQDFGRDSRGLLPDLDLKGPGIF